jgi:aminomethyltransferase
VRDGAELFDGEGKSVGRVTSGGFGPTVGGPVAMGYVEAAYTRAKTRLDALVRGRAHPVEVVELPFIQQRYYRG